MAAHPKPPAVSKAKVQKLLDDYACPVPLHEVRTRFMGSIASPKIKTSPIEALKGLWGGELPPVDSMDDLNHLINVLINSFWNSLTRHLKRNAPFKLTRSGPLKGLDGLVEFSLMRRQELDGFAEGLFDGDDAINLPEKAHRGIETLADIRAMFAATYEFSVSDTKPADADQLAKTFENLRQLTVIAEKEIHTVILSCTNARRALLEANTPERPILH